MGKLVTIIGSNGSGKTTLARVVCRHSARFSPLLEDLRMRPFQASFMHDLKTYGFANQVDFLIYRAEQELSIRNSEVIGVQDGGLDLDYYIFSRLFRENQYLSEDEFALVQRLYGLLRSLLPPPDCIIHLNIPVEVLARRRAMRQRELDITASDDLVRIERLIKEWFEENPPAAPVLEINYQDDDIGFSKSIAKVLDFIEQCT
jgi:deoxyadenosine/deoxycytidine kinase